MKLSLLTDSVRPGLNDIFTTGLSDILGIKSETYLLTVRSGLNDTFTMFLSM